MAFLQVDIPNTPDLFAVGWAEAGAEVEKLLQNSQPMPNTASAAPAALGFGCYTIAKLEQSSSLSPTYDYDPSAPTLPYDHAGTNAT